VSRFEDAIALLLEDEGGEYVPDDGGRGPSRWGVTLSTAQSFHSDWAVSDILHLTRFGAEEFYRAAFWDHWNIGLIVDQTLAYGVFNRTVNLGPKVIAWLQEIVGVTPDMLIGSATAAAINKGDPAETLVALRKRASDYYHQDVHDHPEKLPELTGWLIRNAKC